jgi:hypothetical protein
MTHIHVYAYFWGGKNNVNDIHDCLANFWSVNSSIFLGGNFRSVWSNGYDKEVKDYIYIICVLQRREGDLIKKSHPQEISAFFQTACACRWCTKAHCAPKWTIEWTKSTIISNSSPIFSSLENCEQTVFVHEFLKILQTEPLKKFPF